MKLLSISLILSSVLHLITFYSFNSLFHQKTFIPSKDNNTSEISNLNFHVLKSSPIKKLNKSIKKIERHKRVQKKSFNKSSINKIPDQKITNKKDTQENKINIRNLLSANNKLKGEYTHPVYPRESRFYEEQGEVILKIQVSSGEVTDIRIEKSSQFPRLDQSAIQAVNSWRFPKDFSEVFLQRFVFILE